MAQKDTGRDPIFAIRLAEKDADRVRKQARKEGVSISALVREGIELRTGLAMSATATKKPRKKAS